MICSLLDIFSRREEVSVRTPLTRIYARYCIRAQVEQPTLRRDFYLAFVASHHLTAREN